jgi:predicted nucleic acid-binding Zn ribbon protein
MKEPPLKVCPKELCKLEKWGRGKVRRRIGAGAGLIFKGSGFYITDYRSKSYKAAAKNESNSQKSSEKSSSSSETAKTTESKKT